MMATATREFSKASKRASIQVQNGLYVVWVGYSDNIEGTIPARWFRGFSTCSNEYKTASAAEKAVNKFLGN